MNGDRLAFVTGVDPPERTTELAADGLLALAHYFHQFLQHRHLLRLHRWTPAGFLTPRELECLTLASRGRTAAASAQALHRSVETVRLHLKHAIRKLGAANVTQAVAIAIRLDLIEG